MSIILCLGLLYKPIKIVQGSFQDLVDATPDDEANERIEILVRKMAEKYHLPGVAWIKTRKAGRKIFLTVCYRVEQTRSIKEMDVVRNEMEKEVRKAVPEWMWTSILAPRSSQRSFWHIELRATT